MPFLHELSNIGCLTMLPQEIIGKKRDGKKLTSEEIEEFVRGIDDWSVSDGQIAALTMAMLINGTDTDEMIGFINAIVDTGMVLDWSAADLDGPVVGLCAMPGVGDKLEILSAPIMAACGAYAPMMCERMLYHTGGSLDKLESIRGFTSRPSLSRFRKTLRNAGCAFMSPTDQIIPADSRIQGIRDVTATVNSVPMLIVSMMAKKIASGLKTLAVDIKSGSGAFTETVEAARNCAEKIKEAGKAFEIETVFTYSDMDRIIGSNIGNALEIQESWSYLTCSPKQRDAELHEEVVRLCSASLLQNGLASTAEEAKEKIETALSSGSAAEHFGKMLCEQGVSPGFTENPAPYLPTAQIIRPVYPDREGYVEGMNLRWIGLAVIQMGGGHLYLEQKIDYAAGYTNMCKPGMYVSPRVPLAFVHANDAETADRAAVHLKGAVRISEQPA